MKKKKTVKHIVTGCILLGMLIILGSLQVIFSPYTFDRGVMVIAVTGCSVGVGAFKRELFILKKST